MSFSYIWSFHFTHPCWLIIDTWVPFPNWIPTQQTQWRRFGVTELYRHFQCVSCWTAKTLTQKVPLQIWIWRTMIRSIAFLRKLVGTSLGLNEYPQFCNLGIIAAQVLLVLWLRHLPLSWERRGGQTRVDHLLYTYETNWRIQHLIGLISFGI